VIAAAVAVSPGQAKAECGDYVHIVPNGGTERPHERKPGRGQNCSSNPLPDTPPMTNVVELKGEKELAEHTWKCVEKAAKADRTRPLAMLLMPESHPRSIFHPPRHV